MRTIMIFGLVLLLGACTYPSYQGRPIVGGNAPMKCETAVSTSAGYELDCRGKENLSKAEAIEAMRQADALNAPPVNYSLFGVYSAYPYVITRGHYDRRLYGGPKYIYGGGYGYTRYHWSFGNRY